MNTYIVTNQKSASDGIVENYTFNNKQHAIKKARELEAQSGVWATIGVFNSVGQKIGSL